MSPLKKSISVSLLALIFYLYGILTMRLEIFPYDQIRLLYEKIEQFRDTGFSDKFRKITTESPITSVDDSKKIGVFLTYGQSNSANHGQYGYDVRSYSVHMFMDGKTYVYKDPAIGGSGSDGSVWGRLGDLLISKGHYEAVVFAVTGYEARTIGQLAEPPYIDFMLSQYHALIKEYGRVDGLLIHQGESNHRKHTSLDYRTGFEKFLNRLPENLKFNLFLSRASYCGRGGTDPDVTNAQDSIINAYKNVFPGPNTDLLIQKQDRLPDRCHMSSEGLDQFASLWLASLEQHLIHDSR